MRRVVILGGSNSMMANGWVQRLAAAVPSGFVVENRSIGACTSFMGIFRFLTAPDWQPGDVVVWEYAINEFSFTSHMNLPFHVALEDLSWLVHLCEARGLCFLPVVMQTKCQAARTDRDPYLTRLFEFFHDCGIDPVDCARLAAQDAFAARPGLDLYQDPVHYRLDTGFTDLVAETVAARLEHLRPLGPVRHERVEAKRAQKLDVITGFTGDGLRRFENSRLSLDYHRYSAGCQADCRGIVKGAIVVSTPYGAGVTLHHDGVATTTFATQCADWSKGPILLQMSFDGHYYPARLAVDRPLAFRRPTIPITSPVVLPQHTWNAEKANPDSFDGLVALIVETPL